MIGRAARFGCALLCLLATTAHADAGRPKHKHRPPPSAAKVEPVPEAPSEPAADAPPSAAAAPNAPAPDQKPAAEPTPSLPDGHTPALTERVEPRDGVRTGQVIQLEIGASVPVGDDVTIAEQSFEPFEVHKKSARVEPPQNGKQRFVFNLELLALEPGDQPIPPIELRVVTKDNSVGAVKTDSVPYKIRSLVANEPNAQPKKETKPVTVLQDNWLPIYLGIGLLAIAVVAALTLLVSRWLRARKKAAIPPPPPRPPWEVAIEKLGELRRQKQQMLDAGQGALFVDQLCNVIRAYLGGRYAFDGLETTTDEMLMQLRTHGAALGFTQEVGQFLGRCDLVKFAKVEPDGDEVDLLFAKAQDLVHFSEPEPAANGGGPGPNSGAAPRSSLTPQEPNRSARPVIGERQP
ncbi:MAG TPA: hypothetical protein VHZ95_05030 [Polyangiales bacterium]|nr:hypothetical protein [Polyangiales bacterium]